MDVVHILWMHACVTRSRFLSFVGNVANHLGKDPWLRHHSLNGLLEKIRKAKREISGKLYDKRLHLVSYGQSERDPGCPSASQILASMLLSRPNAWKISRVSRPASLYLPPPNHHRNDPKPACGTPSSILHRPHPYNISFQMACTLPSLSLRLHPLLSLPLHSSLSSPLLP